MSAPPPQSGPTPDESERRSQGALSSDELLPPVEPPSGRFILQLFVIPAIIVAAVLLFGLVIRSLAQSGTQDPDEIVGALRSSNQARFQRAKDLADMLRQPGSYPKLKTNRELAQKLGALLEEQVEAGDDGESAVTMRIFLCTALGEFHVDDGLPALLQAARSDRQRDVRRRAINAIAVLAGELSRLNPPQRLANDELVEALLALADDSDELVRSESAFAIGVVAAAPDADPRLTAKLEELADDVFTDARFNAAVALARTGNPRAASAIAEMLSADSLAASVSGEKAMTPDVGERELRSQKKFKRNTIVSNALSAVTMLLAKGPLSAETRATLERALSTFIAEAPQVREPAPIPEELLAAANQTLAKVRAASSSVAPEE